MGRTSFRREVRPFVVPEAGRWLEAREKEAMPTEHNHPDLLDDAIDQIEGLQMERRQPAKSAQCPHCGSRKVFWEEMSSLFTFACSFCGTIW